MLSHTSTEWAPWYVIPADRKWFARIAAAAVHRQRPDRDRPALPAVSDDAAATLLEVKRDSRPRRPSGAAPDPFEAPPRSSRPGA